MKQNLIKLRSKMLLLCFNLQKIQVIEVQIIDVRLYF